MTQIKLTDSMIQPKPRENSDDHGVLPNAAVQRPHNAVSSAARVHNEVTHMRCARAAVSRSAATACYALGTTRLVILVSRRRIFEQIVRICPPSVMKS